jgi:hypothetical protein
METVTCAGCGAEIPETEAHWTTWYGDEPVWLCRECEANDADQPWYGW